MLVCILSALTLEMIVLIAKCYPYKGAQFSIKQEFSLNGLEIIFNALFFAIVSFFVYTYMVRFVYKTQFLKCLFNSCKKLSRYNRQLPLMITPNTFSESLYFVIRHYI